ncbi:MAG: hypothetical protein ACYTFT_16350, partial [Planctomycetota bacterium]
MHRLIRWLTQVAITTQVGVTTLIAITFVAGPALALDRDALLARHAQIDQSMNAGQGYSAHKDSGTLAWAESYILQSYVEAYRASGDRSYLDKIVDHGDRVLSTATDPQGDTRLGWQTARYSTSRSLNGKFDDKACRFLCPSRLKDLPKDWERWQSSRSTAFRAKSGDNAYVVVKTDPSRGWQVLQSKLTGYVPGERYQVL